MPPHFFLPKLLYSSLADLCSQGLLPAMRLIALLPALVIACLPFEAVLFAGGSNTAGRSTISRNKQLFAANSANDENVETTSTSTYETSDASSRGIVSSLTGVVNLIMGPSKDADEKDKQLSPPPASPQELLERIKADYIVNNYLWTGDIDLAAFEEDCQFTDPTLTFTGRDKFVSNVSNLRPIVDALIEPGGCASKLLDISLNEEEGYVQSRWNMVGDLTGLPWKPRIDVIGRTKFWYDKEQGDASNEGIGDVRVKFYDEEWELPAWKALLQLVTKAGTIPSSSE